MAAKDGHEEGRLLSPEIDAPSARTTCRTLAARVAVAFRLYREPV